MRGDGRTDRRNTYRRTDMTILTVVFAILRTRLKLLYYFGSCCDYDYLKNLIKLRQHCLAYSCYIILVCCFNKRFLITFGKFHFKQSSATRSKCLTQMHYAHSQATSRGPKCMFYLLLAVDETAYAQFTYFQKAQDGTEH